MAFAALLQGYESPYFEELVEQTKKKGEGYQERLSDMVLQKKAFDDSSSPSDEAWREFLGECRVIIERFSRRKIQMKKRLSSDPVAVSPLKGKVLQQEKEQARVDILKGTVEKLSSSEFAKKFHALSQLANLCVTVEEARQYKFGKKVEEISKQEATYANCG